MNMIQAEDFIVLFVDKKAVFGLRKNTEFLPKGATIVAVFTKKDGVVSSISQDRRLTPLVLRTGPRTHSSIRRAAPCFAELWEQAVDPRVIVDLLNGDPCHIDDVGERGKRLAEILYELEHGVKPTPAASSPKPPYNPPECPLLPGEFERSMR